MLKGIAPSERDSRWHKRHTKKKAADILFRKHSLSSGRRDTLASIRAMQESDKKFKEAQAREAEKKVGITGWFAYTFRRLYRKIKSVFNVASFHGKQTKSDVQPQS